MTLFSKKISLLLPKRSIVKSSIPVALSVFLSLGIGCFNGCSTCGIAYASDLTDIAGRWAAADIENAVSAGYVKGYPGGNFKPEAGVTRAEFIVMMNSAFKVAADQGDDALKDVSEGDWFAKDVGSALAAGFVSGYPDGTFQPQQAVDREEAACLLARLLKLDQEGDLNFSDAGQIDSWAKPSVSGLVSRGIVSGYPDGTFRPKEVISRAEAVVMINKALASEPPTPVTTQLQVADDTVNVRSGPGTGEPKIGQVHLGDIVQARAKSGDNWYQIDFRGGTGWIAGWCVRVYQPSQASNASQEVPDASRGASSDIIGAAKRFLGTPYRYGASGPSSFDCSGFVRYVYSLFGVNLPRVASDQARAGKKVSTPAPDDLVFFSDRKDGYITHVGIYIGNNSFIHACDEGVVITSLDESWYKARYVMACRVIDR